MASGSKTVAVIGAGPAGLVSAKCMLEAGLQPTVFDKHDSIGGLWGPSGASWDSLHTNLSRLICCFADLPWNPDIAMFPHKTEVCSYLSEYVEKFVTNSNGRDVFKLNSEISSITPLGGGDSTRWLVRWKANNGDEQDEAFDHVVVASGYFTNPSLPPVKGLDTYPGLALHSSQYRSPADYADKTVAVVGSVQSGMEIAAELATVARKTIHITTTRCWVLPRFVPLEPANPSTPFVPLDWALFRRRPRLPPGVPQPQPQEALKKAHELFGSLVGDQKQWIAPELEVDKEKPVYLAVSDYYPALVRDGKIQVVSGRLEAVQGSDLVLHDGTVLSDIDTVILCTGYTPQLPIFGEDILSELSFDPKDRLVSVLLHRNVWHPKLPNMAFVGMYKNPHFPVMELQARWVAGTFAGTVPPIPEDVQLAGIAQQAKIRAAQPRPQITGSLLDFADGIAAELGLLPPESLMRPGETMLPQHYSGNAEVAEAASAALQAAVVKHKNGRMVARTVARALQGTWCMDRQIESCSPGIPSGKVSGTAKFSLTSCSTMLTEYLYSEEGEFEMPGGQRLPIHKKYVWRYSPKDDRIDLYFSEDDVTSKGFFHSLKFWPPSKDHEDTAPGSHGGQNGTDGGANSEGDGVVGQTNVKRRGWVADAEHLCGQDMYITEYHFVFQAVNMSEFDITHKVHGPQKDYTSTTMYTRQWNSS